MVSVAESIGTEKDLDEDKSTVKTAEGKLDDVTILLAATPVEEKIIDLGTGPVYIVHSSTVLISAPLSSIRTEYFFSSPRPNEAQTADIWKIATKNEPD